MKDFDKFKIICVRYNVYFERISNIKAFLVNVVMLKAYEHHKDINFETFVRSCIKDPLNYLLQVSELLDEIIDLNMVNNCFNDKDKTHFGCKFEGNWFFITHSGSGLYCRKLTSNEYKIKSKYSDNTSYLVSYKNVQPNVLRFGMGTIKKKVIKEYITKFL